MRLLCINDKTIIINGLEYFGTYLVKGKIYEGTVGDVIKDMETYNIDGIGPKFAFRFRRVDDFADAILNNIKEEMETELIKD
jgi:hypothetical protein